MEAAKPTEAANDDCLEPLAVDFLIPIFREIPVRTNVSPQLLVLLGQRMRSAVKVHQCRITVNCGANAIKVSPLPPLFGVHIIFVGVD